MSRRKKAARGVRLLDAMILLTEIQTPKISPVGAIDERIHTRGVAV